MTIGTNIPLILSANFDIGALDAEASLTNDIICESVVSFPTFVALKMKAPVLLIVAVNTVSPCCLKTGILSPVSADSSMEVFPFSIIPSTGIHCPGFTITKSPTITSSTGTSFSML